MRKNYTKESWQRVLDAQRRGNETYRKNIKLKKDKEKKEYNKSPKLCLICKIPLSYEKRKNTFCSHSCSCIYNNGAREKTIKSKVFCFNCGKEIIETNYCKRNFCSLQCSGEYNRKKNFDKKIILFNSGMMDDYQARIFFRKITEKICSVCGLSKWMGKEIPLVVDHVDGNHNNNFPENLRFVCCNCDAQLDTYKAKNKGNGRIYRRNSQ